MVPDNAFPHEASGEALPSDPRRAALLRYDILGSPPEAAFDRITDLAAHLLQTPMAGIHFIDDACQWAKSQTGLDATVLSLDVSFCARALDREPLLVVPDATKDPRFADTPLVTGEPGVRFYAGAALTTPDGVTLGRLCVLDTTPRPDGLTDHDADTLTRLAQVVMDELEYRAQPRLRESILESITDGFVAIDRERIITYLNDQAAQLLQRPRDTLLGANACDEFPEAVDLPFYEHYERAMETGESTEFEAHFPPLNTWFEIRAYPIASGGLSIYFRDTTERHAQEAKLRLMSRAVEDAAEAVIITEGAPINVPGPRIEYVNPAFEAMTGYTAAEVLGKTPRILQGPNTDRAILDKIRVRLERGEAIPRTVTQNYRKDGTPFWVEWTITPVHDEDGAVDHWVSVQRDVSERHQLQNALATHRERLEMALVGGRVGMWDWDIRTDATVYDERWASILGYTLEDLEYENSFFERRTHPDDLARVYDDIERHASGELPYLDQEIRMLHRDGTWRWVLDRGKIVERDDNGRPLRMVGTHVDITERKQAEEELRISEERFDLAVRGSQDGIWDWDLTTDEVWYSDRFIELLGWTRETFGSTIEAWSEVVHPDDHTPTLAAIDAHLRDGVPYDAEYRCQSASGAYRWFQARGQAVWNDDGEPVRMAGSIRDITDQKRQASIEQRFGRLLQAVPSEIYIFDAETLRFVKTSQGARENLGYSAGEMRERTPLDLKPMDRSAFEALLDPLRGGDQSVVRFDTTHRRADGTMYPVQVRVHHNREEVRPVFIAIVIDITERKAREQELIEAKERAEEMSRLKSSFLANMSHEIRTPLTSIIGFAEVLQGELNGSHAEMLSMIFRSGRRLKRTLTSVLDLARLESNAVKLKAEPVDLREEVHEAVSMFSQTADEKGLRLDVDVPNAPTPIPVDREAVQRILTNLISNAVKFTSKGHVRVGLYPGKTQVVMEVEDTGIGIDPNLAEDLFQEFTQASEGLTRGYEGVGLGLPITRRLTKLLGGEIVLQSQEGEGSLFTVTLPRRTPPQHPVVAQAPTKSGLGEADDPPTAYTETDAPLLDISQTRSVQSAPERKEGPHLLLVDDNEMSRQVFALLLRQVNPACRIDEASDASSALSRAEETSYDGFVIDIDLGEGMNGVDLMHRLRDNARHADAPMMACTAHALSGDEERLREAGFDVYLPKPYRTDDLRAAVDQMWATDA